MLCESGEKNLDAYFNSVEQAVEMVSAYVESDLANTDLSQLDEHLSRARDIFAKITYKSIGVLTYYYRIDPLVSTTSKGFWFVNLDGEGFVEHEPTDITLYDTGDTSQLVWFTVPKTTGKPVWQPPYITDNLDVRVLSYNVPIYKDGVFIGVVGIELDYSTMAEQVDSIRLYDNGYAFINDAEGNIVYHPHMDVATMDEPPVTPTGVLSEGKFIRYRFNGVEKQAVWLPLNDGKRLNVTVPVSEINAGWRRWVVQIIIVSIVLLIVFILVTMEDFAEAIETRQFLVHYQPKYDIRKSEPVLNSAEALVRWKHPELGMIRPDQFIPPEAFEKLIEARMAIDEQGEPIELSHRIPRLSSGEYSYDALHDPLTGLYNYTAFEMLVKDADRYHTALVIAQVTEVRQILEDQGQIAAEMVLKRVADLLRRSFRSVDHICRISSSEFAIIMTRVDSSIREQLKRKVAQINDRLGAPTENMPPVSLAVGAAFADRVNPGGSVFEDAEAALAHVKQRGGAGCALY